MIYSASRRTDMTASFPGHIVDRVRRSRRLEAIVFWTKDIRNLVNHPGLAAVRSAVPCVVQYTVTGLAGSPWEPAVPPLAVQKEVLSRLAESLPAGAIQWRFDPILFTPDVMERFVNVKETLEQAMGPLSGVTVSFADPYKKAVARSRRAGLLWPESSIEERKLLLEQVAACFTATDPGPVRLCCEPELLSLPFTSQARCIDGSLFARLYGLALEDLPKDGGQRPACGCVRSTDIGSYDMLCPHRCQYCYARPDDSDGQEI